MMAGAIAANMGGPPTHTIVRSQITMFPDRPILLLTKERTHPVNSIDNSVGSSEM